MPVSELGWLVIDTVTAVREARTITEDAIERAYWPWCLRLSRWLDVLLQNVLLQIEEAGR